MYPLPLKQNRAPCQVLKRPLEEILDPPWPKKVGYSTFLVWHPGNGSMGWDNTFAEKET